MNSSNLAVLRLELHACAVMDCKLCEIDNVYTNPLKVYLIVDYNIVLIMLFNSLRPSDAYMRRLDGAKPLSELMLEYS